MRGRPLRPAQMVIVRMATLTDKAQPRLQDRHQARVQDKAAANRSVSLRVGRKGILNPSRKRQEVVQLALCKRLWMLSNPDNRVVHRVDQVQPERLSRAGQAVAAVARVLAKDHPAAKAAMGPHLPVPLRTYRPSNSSVDPRKNAPPKERAAARQTISVKSLIKRRTSRLSGYIL